MSHVSLPPPSFLCSSSTLPPPPSSSTHPPPPSFPRYTEHTVVSLAQQWDQLGQMVLRVLHNLEQQIQARYNVPMFPCSYIPHVPRSLYPHVSMSLYPHTPTFLYPHISMSLYPHIPTFLYPHVPMSLYPHVSTVQMYCMRDASLLSSNRNTVGVSEERLKDFTASFRWVESSQTAVVHCPIATEGILTRTVTASLNTKTSSLVSARWVVMTLPSPRQGPTTLGLRPSCLKWTQTGKRLLCGSLCVVTHSVTSL